MMKQATKHLAAAGVTAALALAGCAEVKSALTEEQIDDIKHRVAVYLETDDIPNIDPPWRLDLEMVGDDPSGTKPKDHVSYFQMWERCDDMGGQLVTYEADTWVYIAGRYYCEGVDY